MSGQVAAVAMVKAGQHSHTKGTLAASLVALIGVHVHVVPHLDLASLVEGAVQNGKQRLDSTIGHSTQHVTPQLSPGPTEESCLVSSWLPHGQSTQLNPTQLSPCYTCCCRPGVCQPAPPCQAAALPGGRCQACTGLGPCHACAGRCRGRHS